MKKNKIFDLPIASNLGNALTETMKSVSQHEGGIKHGEINLPNFKKEVRDFKKQETLEEVDNEWSLSKAQEFALSKFKRGETPSKGIMTWEHVLEVLKAGVLTGHKFGAKWQAERMYSEEEVLHLMILAFEQGFKKADVVEAGLEAKETDIEVNWIFLKHKK
jgi:hypothetical protein